MSNRSHWAKVNNFYSHDEDPTFSVPQGSVLGPTLFLVYVVVLFGIDSWQRVFLCQLSMPNCKRVAHVDDTTLVLNGESWSAVIDSAKSALKIVMNRLTTNFLTSNLSKIGSFVLHQIQLNQKPKTTERHFILSLQTSIPTFISFFATCCGRFGPFFYS